MNRFLLPLALANLLSAQTPPVAAPEAQGITLTDESLQRTLADMGLEPKRLGKGYLILVERDKWKMYVQFRLSDDQSKVGMNANLGVVKEEAVTADQWKALLAANEDIDPSVFFYAAKQKKLYIHRVLDNHSLTPSYLRQQLDNFLSNLKSTKDLWTPLVP